MVGLGTAISEVKDEERDVLQNPIPSAERQGGNLSSILSKIPSNLETPSRGRQCCNSVIFRHESSSKTFSRYF